MMFLLWGSGHRNYSVSIGKVKKCSLYFFLIDQFWGQKRAFKINRGQFGESLLSATRSLGSLDTHCLAPTIGLPQPVFAQDCARA